MLVGGNNLRLSIRADGGVAGTNRRERLDRLDENVSKLTALRIMLRFVASKAGGERSVASKIGGERVLVVSKIKGEDRRRAETTGGGRGVSKRKGIVVADGCSCRHSSRCFIGVSVTKKLQEKKGHTLCPRFLASMMDPEAMMVWVIGQPGLSGLKPGRGGKWRKPPSSRQKGAARECRRGEGVVSRRNGRHRRYR